MQRILRHSLPIFLIAATIVIFGTGRTYADTVCEQVDAATGQCKIWADAPGGGGSSGGGGDAAPVDGPKDTGSGNPCFWDPSKQGAPGSGGPVDCTSPYGTWSNTYGCYLEAADPPPPAGDPAWKGHEPGDGAVYNCYQPQTALLIYIWAADPPAGAAAGPTPREVAQMAVEQLDLAAIDIGIAPKPGQGNVGLVGMPVWMWANHPDRHTYGPATASASAGGITVSATARVHSITWDMGDGTTIVCDGPGTAYGPEFGKKASPDCGHVYRKSSAHEPGETYTVTATSAWVVQWTGAGQTGTIRLNGLFRSVQITVGEAQVLVN